MSGGYTTDKPWGFFDKISDRLGGYVGRPIQAMASRNLPERESPNKFMDKRVDAMRALLFNAHALGAATDNNKVYAVDHDPIIPQHMYVEQRIPEIQGAAMGGYRSPVSEYDYSSLVEGLSPVEEIRMERELMDRYIRNAKRWAGTPMAEQWPGQYPYRQPDTMAANAEYVGQYLEAAMTLAPYFDLPPRTIAAMLMQESGWGGQRFEGNLGGYGMLDDGRDLGIRFGSDDDPWSQARGYLNRVSSDWDGRYRGSRSPMDFHKKGYNPHAVYPEDVMKIMRMLEAE